MVLHIIRTDILLIARIFLAPSGLGKILRNSQNIRAYYMQNHRLRYMYHHGTCPYKMGLLLLQDK